MQLEMDEATGVYVAGSVDIFAAVQTEGTGEVLAEVPETNFAVVSVDFALIHLGSTVYFVW